MIIFPAIDIKNGKVVRLLQGKFDQVTEYSNDPVEMAKQWEGQGAEWLHVVDLDGALEGQPKNLNIIKNVAKSVKIPIQVGGGIREIENINALLNAQIARVVLGTRVVSDEQFLKNAITVGKEKIAVSLDCSKGMVAQRGWTEVSNIKAIEFAQQLVQSGLKYLIYTDIARDGMLTGPNIEELKSLLKTVKTNIIASGGVADMNDLKKLKSLEKDGLIGVITGKAIYEGKLDLKKAIALCSQNG